MTSVITPDPVRRQPELIGQRVVMIGGSAGIGLEMARRARLEGAQVVLTGRDPVRLEQAGLDVGAQRTSAFDATDTAALHLFFEDLPTPIDHVMLTAAARTTGLCWRWTHPSCATRSAITWCWGSRSPLSPLARCGPGER